MDAPGLGAALERLTGSLAVTLAGLWFHVIPLTLAQLLETTRHQDQIQEINQEGHWPHPHFYPRGHVPSDGSMGLWLVFKHSAPRKLYHILERSPRGCYAVRTLYANAAC